MRGNQKRAFHAAKIFRPEAIARHFHLARSYVGKKDDGGCRY